MPEEITTLEALKAQLAALESAWYTDPSPREVMEGISEFKGQTGEAGANLLIAEQVDRGQQTGVLKATIVSETLKANQGEITLIHTELKNDIHDLIKALDEKYIALGADPMHTIMFVRDVDAEGQLIENGIVSIAVNPQKTRPGNKNGGNGSGLRSSDLVCRNINGATEEMTVKDAIQAYGDRSKQTSSWDKSNWAFLFKAQNGESLVPAFEILTKAGVSVPTVVTPINNPEKSDNKPEDEKASEKASTKAKS